MLLHIASLLSLSPYTLPPSLSLTPSNLSISLSLSRHPTSSFIPLPPFISAPSSSVGKGVGTDLFTSPQTAATLAQMTPGPPVSPEPSHLRPLLGSLGLDLSRPFTFVPWSPNLIPHGYPSFVCLSVCVSVRMCVWGAGGRRGLCVSLMAG